MASEKKAMEGIALLSLYNDEDDEMEDLDDDKENIYEDGIPPLALDAVTVNDSDGVGDHGNKNSPRQLEERGFKYNSTPNEAFSNFGTSPASATQKLAAFSPQQRQQRQPVVSEKSRPTIVDYGNEEGALSPEAEEGEILATGRVMYGEQLGNNDGMW